jgi:hypothetical protein
MPTLRRRYLVSFDQSRMKHQDALRDERLSAPLKGTPEPSIIHDPRDLPL